MAVAAAAWTGALALAVLAVRGLVVGPVPLSESGPLAARDPSTSVVVRAVASPHLDLTQSVVMWLPLAPTPALFKMGLSGATLSTAMMVLSMRDMRRALTFGKVPPALVLARPDVLAGVFLVLAPASPTLGRALSLAVAGSSGARPRGVRERGVGLAKRVLS